MGRVLFDAPRLSFSCFAELDLHVQSSDILALVPSQAWSPESNNYIVQEVLSDLTMLPSSTKLFS